MKRLLRFALALLLGTALAAAGQDFKYDVVIDAPRDLAALLRENLEIEKWRSDPRIDLSELRRLVREAPAEIETLLATEGYYTPAVTSRLDETPAGWVARFEVVPGEAARVADVEIAFSGAITAQQAGAKPDREALRRSWKLPRGSVFRQADWEAAKRALLGQLLTESYPAAAIADSVATVDPKTREARLKVEVDSGPAFTFGPVEISGLKRYPESIVRNLSPIRPGDPYNQEKLVEFQTKLQGTGYFSSVEVMTETDPERSQGVPVKVAVTENPRKKLGFGVGFSTNTGQRGQITYEDANLRGRGWRLRSALRLESKVQFLGGEILLPVNDRGYRDSVNAYTERSDISGQINNALGIGARRTWGGPQFERSLGLQYQREHTKIAGSADDNAQALVGNYSLTWRRVDDLISPTNGYFLNVQLGAAPTPLFTDTPFGRVYARGTGYFPIGRSTTAILRGEAGFVGARERRGIPQAFLFRTGGDQSVRGYAFQTLGVREGDAVVGGRYLAVASAELVQWITPKYGVAVFYDAGNASDVLHEFRFAQGYGVGARWKSPVGPLAADFAYGKDERKTRFHFSLGVTF